ncbi:hypothetical protein QQS21_012582 [Conoideocrella luteorostrata]|uniref:CENP-V/GFA domain-containing protein n=1 Tax=Conoideocrella luteorostrata TaxID=1105319 RepID=A0AAJ0CD87_9HYPO|nr:hypothetical protein QQS21_012582 [Conoideocrella luteorostrata]
MSNQPFPQPADPASSKNVWYSCHCHCGAKAFKIHHEPLVDTAPQPAPVMNCNCSICETNGYLLLYVYRTDIEHIRGWDDLKKYQFASKTRDHLFCGICGTSVGIDFLGSNRKGDLIAINVCRSSGES